jgi:(2Fe-2S) ferredoxin
MTDINESPYLCHVFVCTNDRQGQRPSCADQDNALVRSQLKEAVGKRGWKPRVRISQCGCMGLCGKGSNVIIYPQKIWFSKTFPEDVDRIIAEIEKIVASAD